jgi:thioredoxin reductase (NADPH)
MQDRLFRNPKIEVVWNHVVDEVLGEQNPPRVTGVRLQDVTSGAARTLAVDGLFVAIGHNPASELFKGQLETDAEGYIKTRPDSTRTSVPGIFAAGDVKDKVFRQAVTAAGMGCMAALEAEKFLAAEEAVPALEAAQ